MRTGLTIAELQRQVGQLKEAKGFDAREVLRLSHGGNKDIGKMDAADVWAVVENPGMEIYDVIRNLRDLADMDLRVAFAKATLR
ncbi:hypothetical protein BH24ACT19_BH24ACT19_19870 [soil metagenome]